MHRYIRNDIFIPSATVFFSMAAYHGIAKTKFGRKFFKVTEEVAETKNFFELMAFSSAYNSVLCVLWMRSELKISSNIRDLSYLDYYKARKTFWALRFVCVLGLSAHGALFVTVSKKPIFAIAMISLCCLSTDGLLTYLSIKNGGFYNTINSDGLNFDNYPELRSLPRGLRVPELRIRYCPKFTTLPEDIHVDGNIELFHCPALTALPENLHFGGNLYLQGCSGLTSLPENITRLGLRSDGEVRLVNLTGSGLSDEYIDRLRNEPAPGMQFHFARQQEYIPNEPSFNNLEEAINFWKEIPPREAIPDLHLEGQELANMITFLDRLANTAEYRNIQTKQPLAVRVLDMVSCISQDDETKEKAIDLINEGLISCDDRIIATLDDIELLGKIQESERGSPAPESEEKLRSLGLAIYKLEEVRKSARRHMANLNWVDEVEVQLAFQIGLTDFLKLPLSTQNMIFRRCAAVSGQQIADAGQEILENCTERNINEFLQSWDPWKRHIRRKIIPDYEALNSLKIDQAVQCEILHEEANKPVKCKNNVFGYQALCKVYIQSGQNPCTREPINWNDVKRLQI